MGTVSRGNIVSKEQTSKPGPGHYEQKTPRSHYAATITGKPADNQRNDSPGPGHYNEDHGKVKDKVIAYKMSPVKRGEIVSNEASSKPGPGMYNAEAPRSHYAATITGKPADMRRNDAPGPGTYEDNTRVVKDKTPAYQMSPVRRGDIVSSEQTSKPGPGHYNAEAPRSQYSATITGKPADMRRNDAPGPGTYEDNTRVVKDKTPAYQMSPVRRGDIVSSEQTSKPGPGHYNAEAPRS